MNLWLRGFLIPLVVGIALAIVAFLLPRLFKESKEVSYTVEGPVVSLDSTVMAGIRLSVNGVPTKEIYGYRARLWNSGSQPVAHLGVRFVFSPPDSAFSILSARHKTTPPYEFGGMAQTESTSTSRRYLYDLLNTGDEDLVTFVTTRTAALNVFAKAEGLSLKRVELDRPSDLIRRMRETVPLAVAVVATLSGFLTMLLTAVATRHAIRDKLSITRILKDQRSSDK